MHRTELFSLLIAPARKILILKQVLIFSMHAYPGSLCRLFTKAGTVRHVTIRCAELCQHVLGSRMNIFRYLLSRYGIIHRQLKNPIDIRIREEKRGREERFLSTLFQSIIPMTVISRRSRLLSIWVLEPVMINIRLVLIHT